MSSVTNFPSGFISAYRKGCSTNHVILRLTENWKAALDSNLFKGVWLFICCKTKLKKKLFFFEKNSFVFY